MMRSMSLGPRAQAALVLALVALVGALVGILGDRIVAQQRADSAPDSTTRDVMQRRGDGPRRGPGMSRFADQLETRLDLSPDQRAAIENIIAEEQQRVRALTAEFQPRFRLIAQQTRERVDSVLTPAQREELRAMRRQRMPDVGRGMPRDTLMPGPPRSP